MRPVGRWGSNDESVIMFDSKNSTSTIRALKVGSAIIAATCTVNWITKTDTVTIKVRTPRGLISGEDYYIMNLQTGKYLAIPSGGDYNGVPLSIAHDPIDERISSLPLYTAGDNSQYLD